MAYPNLEKILIAGLDAVMAADNIINKEGIFSLLKYSADFSQLGGLNAANLLAEIKSLNDAEKANLENIVKQRLVLHEPALQAKIDAGVDVLDMAVTIVENVVNEVEALVAKSKSVFAPKP